MSFELVGIAAGRAMQSSCGLHVSRDAKLTCSRLRSVHLNIKVVFLTMTRAARWTPRFRLVVQDIHESLKGRSPLS